MTTTNLLEFPSQIDFVQFVSNYAHDLRSPFNRMMGFMKIVLKGQDGPLTDLQKEDLNTVYQNSVYAFTVIANLIDISRLLLGEKSLNPVEISISALFQQATSQWQKYHADPQVQFETELPAEMDPIQADSVLLSQALMGLIACVIECVKPPVQVSLSAQQEPDKFLFTVRSTGKPAINPSRLDIDSYGYISQALISLHGGEFKLKEAGDEGAVIQFVLPKK
jgi:K+-sensing histidine kinase KdpD